MRITIEDGLIEGDKVMARCTVRGTHLGEGIGIAPTQKPVTFTGMCMARVKNGQIAEAWNSFDFLALYQQIAAAPGAFARNAVGRQPLWSSVAH